ncbi:MAG TPA: DUF4910 domain-containing protein, partial [Candidatus Acidoferrum sp.]|nr:DUF4910 domain-containing protein [Candidatus Acidoferrum sp.]
CSPGFNLPVGCFMRSQHGTFPEYHTSADNLSFITPAALQESFDCLRRVVELIESGRGFEQTHVRSTSSINAKRHGRFFRNLKPKGEPQLGKHGFYEAIGPHMIPALWVLNFSDGLHALDEIAARAGLPFDSIDKAADVLSALGLVKEVGASA